MEYGLFPTWRSSPRKIDHRKNPMGKEGRDMKLNVGILGFDEVEALDFVGPYEVFTTASRVADREGFPIQFNVIAIANQPSFTARAGLTFAADCHFYFSPKLDVLVVPGGVTKKVEDDPEVINWLQIQAGDVPVLASVCTGSFLLAKANLLNKVHVTTHWEDIAALRATYPELELVENVRWVDNGKIVTSAGISAGIDMSLHLVERLGSRELALLTARQMDYEWVDMNGGQ